MAEDKSNSPVTLNIARQHKGKSRRYSTGQASIAKSEENAVPHYLRASTGSCHDFCKYGIKDAQETKTRTSMLRRVSSGLHDDPILVKSAELPSRKSALARRPKSSSDSKSLTLDSSNIIRKHLSTPETQNSVETEKKKISVENVLLPGQKSKLAIKSKVVGSKSLMVDAATNINQKVKQKGSTPLRQNSEETEGSAERKEKSVKLKSSPGLKTHLSGAKGTNEQEILSSCEASKQVLLKVKERSLSGMHSASTNRNHTGLKKSPPSITPIRLNKKSSSDSPADRIKGSARRIFTKNVVVPQTAIASSNSSVRKVPSLTSKNRKFLKGVSHERNENKTENIKAAEMDNEEVSEKTLYVIDTKDENDVSYFEATVNANTSYDHNQNGASIVSLTASHHSEIESASSRDLQSVLFQEDLTEQAKCINDEKASIDAISIPQLLSSPESLSLMDSHSSSLHEEDQVEQPESCINDEKASINAIFTPQPLSSPESLSLGDSHSTSLHKADQVEQAKLCVNDGKSSIDAIPIPQPLSSPEPLSLGDPHSSSLHKADQVEQAKLCVNDEKASIDAIPIPQPLSSLESLSLGDSHSSSLHKEDQVEQAKLCVIDEKASIDAFPVPQPLPSPESISLGDSHSSSLHQEDQVEQAELCVDDAKASINAISIPQPLSSPKSLSLEDSHASLLHEEDQAEQAKLCINDEKASINTISIPQPLLSPESSSLGDSHFSSLHEEDQVELAGSHNCSLSERSFESSPSHSISSSLSSSHEEEKEEEAEEDEEEEELELEYSVDESEDFSISDVSDTDLLETAEILEAENKGNEKESGVVYIEDYSISDGCNMDVLEKTEGENKGKAMKSGVVYTKDVDGKPVKLHFRRGKVVEIQTENNAPTRLKFRQGRVLDVNESLKADAQRKSTKRREETHGVNDGMKPGSRKVVLRRKGALEEKNSKGLFNNVIEETASKLVEMRKSKVKALVGAFETVISLQDTKPSTS